MPYNPEQFMTVLFGGTIIACLTALFFLPNIIAHRRDVPHRGLLFLGTLLFGWTAAGWFIALVYACVANPQQAVYAGIVIRPGETIRVHANVPRYYATAALIFLAVPGAAYAGTGWYSPSTADMSGACREVAANYTPAAFIGYQHNIGWQVSTDDEHDETGRVSMTFINSTGFTPQGQVRTVKVAFFRSHAMCDAFAESNRMAIDKYR